MRRRAGATFNVCYDFTFTLPSYVIETIRLSISAVHSLGREPRRCHRGYGNSVPWEHQSGGDWGRTKPTECVADCRAKTWGQRHSNHHAPRPSKARRRQSERFFNRLDRFPPCSPEQGKSMEGTGKAQIGTRRGAWLSRRRCSALLLVFLLSTDTSVDEPDCVRILYAHGAVLGSALRRYPRTCTDREAARPPAEHTAG
jgi:hypothetical protein